MAKKIKARVILPRSEADLEECRRLEEEGKLAHGSSFAEDLEQASMKKMVKALKSVRRKNNGPR
jgi:hypothetical protein